MKILDMIGQPCPIPVIKAKQELAQAAGVTILVDNMVSVQNLQKMAEGSGYLFSYNQKEENYQVQIHKNHSAPPNQGDLSEKPASQSAAHKEEGITVFITANQMGRGSEELGSLLIKGFLFSLTELPAAPKTIIFINSGVKLACQGSNTIKDLKNLVKKGTKILVCGTCLNYYDLSEQLAAGQVTNMFAISEQLSNAARLVTI